LSNTSQQFDRLAVELGGYKTPQRARARCLELFRDIDFRGKEVLEIGAGAGVLSTFAVVCGAKRVVALEPAAEGSRIGIHDKLTLMRDGLNQPHFEISRQRLQDYAIDGSEFDIVVMYNTVNHLDESACSEVHRDPRAVETYQQLFDHVRRLMKVGGLLLIADCSRENFFASLNLRNPLAPDIDWQIHQSPRTWERLILPLGFTRKSLSWYTPLLFRNMPWLIGNRWVNYFLWSHFLLKLEYSRNRESPARNRSIDLQLAAMNDR